MIWKWIFGEASTHEADLYVDLGTCNTLISAPKHGVLLNEPTVLAYSELSPGRKKIVGVGHGAFEKFQKNPGSLSLVRPLRDGVISDFETTHTMLRYFLYRVQEKVAVRRPKLLISLPYGVTEVEKRAVIEAGKKAGAREVLLIDEPMTAAIGAGIDVCAPRGSMIVDIGGGTTEVAVIALGDTVFCKTIRVGGITIDDQVQAYMKKNKGLIISEASAEKIKMELGTAVPKKNIRMQMVTGRDTATGLNRTVEVSSTEIGEAMDESLREIITTVHAALEGTPPELVADIIDDGIILSGGGALIRDLDLRLQNEVRLLTKIAHEPLTTIARGGEKVIADATLLEKLRIDLNI